MKPKDFVDKYWSYAVACERRTTVPALFTLAQAALESGWSESAPGNNFFGIKDTDGMNGNEQLITTVEYSSKSTLIFPQIISKVFDPIKKLYKYIVKAYFRKYTTPEESFVDHAKFFLENTRYHNTFQFIQNPELFSDMVAKDGYATDPNYADKMRKLIRMIDQILKEEGHK